MRAVDGTSISVTNFRGKYLLVDFWASWCIPCREENKKLIRIYPQFPRKDFEILSVALEKEGQSQKWKKAIADDKMVWPQVTDFKYWRSPVVGLYAIQGIPYNVLLDKNGLIIAHDIHGDELTQLLQTLIKK